MECSQNDGSKTQYYVVILDQLQGRSGALERAPELRIRGSLTRLLLSQTSFGHISISSLTIPTVLMAPESP